MQSLAELLLSDYNVYRAQTHSFHEKMNLNWRVGALKATPERIQLLDEMVFWCRERFLEPRLWLFALFKIRNWRFPVKLERGCLLSENLIKKYKNMDGLGFFRRRSMAARFHGPGVDDDFDPNRDMTPHVENLKQQLVQQGLHMQCMDETLLRTMGYHPRSRVCAACPVAAECAVRLEGAVPFGIIALRSGRLTAAQAQIAVHRSQEIQKSDVPGSESTTIDVIRDVVLKALQSGGTWAVPQLAARAQAVGVQTTQTCVSAVVRDLRKAKYGGHTVIGERGDDEVFRYTLVPQNTGTENGAA